MHRVSHPPHSSAAGAARERYRPLLDAVDAYYGVREHLRETLGEYFSDYQEIDKLIEGLQTVLLQNWSYFERSENRSTLFSLLSDIVLDLFRQSLTEDQASRLLRPLLVWCTTVLEGAHGKVYRRRVGEVGLALAKALRHRPVVFLERDSLVRELSRCACRVPVLRDIYLGLYRSLLCAGYERVAERLDVAAWATSRVGILNAPAVVVDAFEATSRKRMDLLSRGAEAADAGEIFSPGYPTYSEILRKVVEKRAQLVDEEDQFSVCLFLLKDDSLGLHQQEVMAELFSGIELLAHPSRHTDLPRVIDRLHRFFLEREDDSQEMRLRCYGILGVAIGKSGASEAAERLMDDLLSWPFHAPDVRGVTDDWQTVVNPFHLPNIRCWMAVIGSNPFLYERLAAGLDVHLRLGGVFISDTALFQRDVTRFLDADLTPVYFIARQLLRSCPIYFNEIGAAGELLEVSAELDDLCGRHDGLLHFLRKQVHAEPSNRLVEFTRGIVLYWMTLDTSYLRPYVSAAILEVVRNERRWADGPHLALRALETRLGSRVTGKNFGEGEHLPDEAGVSSDESIAHLNELLATPLEVLEVQLQEMRGVSVRDNRRVFLLVRLHQLLVDKYSLSAGDLAGRIEAHYSLEAELRKRFVVCLSAWKEAVSSQNRRRIPALQQKAVREELLDTALDVLERLKSVVLTPAPSEAFENFFYRRHIAAGMPSMHGRYTEPKFDSLGLTFRVERLVIGLLEDVATEKVPYVNQASLRDAAATLRRFQRTLAVDGLHSQSFSDGIRLLEASLAQRSFTTGQYRDIFRFLAQSVSDLTSLSVMSHAGALRSILRSDQSYFGRHGLSKEGLGEKLLRKVVVSALGLQPLDQYLSKVLRTVSALVDHCKSDQLNRMIDYDPKRLISWIHEPDPYTDEQVTLGCKALALKRLVEYGYRVPEGFILTTELFRLRPALSCPAVGEDIRELVRAAVNRLETMTGRRMGDPDGPLTLSIRSGAAVSLPGMMVTFTNVGLSTELAERCARGEKAWTVWDCYRRYVQSWALSAGVDRNVFQEIVERFKLRCGVRDLISLTSDQMREMALDCRNRAVQLGVIFIDDPFEQIITGIQKVLASWDDSPAKICRRQLALADDWGTSVIVQRMVSGNLTMNSGAGVTFTRNPLRPARRGICLFGDFAIRSQGEDLVGGRIAPLPVTEAQRREAVVYRGVEQSLERDFPEIYMKLLQLAEDLVADRGYEPQEIEFTFESPAASDLCILQTRPMVQELADESPVFAESGLGRDVQPVAVGIGMAGGALSGRVAIDMAQIETLIAEDPDETIILLRPDTVPEEIAMIGRVHGILTARGGATSHAAVTAKLLRKTAVVDCRSLEVVDREGIAYLSGRKLRYGDWLSIDGRTGRIFWGKLSTASRSRINALSMLAPNFPSWEGEDC